MKVNKIEIIRMYKVDKMSTHQIAKKLGVSQSTVRHHLRDEKLRDRSQAQKIYLETHNHQRKGERHSTEARLKISNALKGKTRGSKKEDCEKTERPEEEVQPQRFGVEG